MVSYNTPAEIRKILHIDSSNQVLTDIEIQVYLDEANAELSTQIKKKYQNDLFKGKYKSDGVTIDPNFKFSLNPVSTIYKVLINDTLLLNTDYSLDLELNILTISKAFEFNDKISIYYTPKVYHFAEAYLCCHNILISTSLNGTGGEQTIILENIINKKNRFLSLISSNLIVGSYY